MFELGSFISNIKMCLLIMKNNFFPTIFYFFLISFECDYSFKLNINSYTNIIMKIMTINLIFRIYNILYNK